jgi:3-oxoacyl-[acyl-carrier protein] reductase
MNKKPLLEDKVAIITGANQGFGLEIAKNYVISGANVVLCARNESLLEEAKSTLQNFSVSQQSIHTLPTDVSKNDDVELVVKAAMDQFGRIDILVNNAGVYGPKGAIDAIDWHEWIYAIEINLYGSVLMCRAVLPYFKAQRKGKIIQLSGGGATNPLPYISAYAVSKAAIVRFVETLAEEVREYLIDVNAIAPGALNTKMLNEILEAGPEKVGRIFYEKALKQKEQGGSPLSRGAELAVFLGSSLSDGVTGKLISAMWDDWENFPHHLKELETSDVYTLRRIVAKDRGFNWGDK